MTSLQVLDTYGFLRRTGEREHASAREDTQRGNPMASFRRTGERDDASTPDDTQRGNPGGTVLRLACSTLKMHT
jgi:hypothetical protein